MSLVRPRAWRPGDRIAVVAPASPFSREEFDRGCAELRRLGFDPVFDDDVFARSWYVAGSAGLRAAAIQRALADPSIAGLIAVRGGFGSMHVLPAMDAATWRAAGKALVGYSDLTSLFAWQTCHVGMVAIHGPMLAGRLSEGEAKYDADSFLRVVGDPTPFGMVPGGGLLTLRAGEATGPLFGGTLTQLCASLATPYAFDPPAGCLLFIEDVGERPYRIDRLLTQLVYAGVIGRASGVVLGEMVECDEPGGPTVIETLASVTAGWDVPVIYGLAAGHARRPVVTLPLGVSARLVAGPSPSLEILDAAVR